MNAQKLLEHFDRLTEAPDAIPRLRRFILDLAVRGKLVEQDPNDEPAAELLKRIAAEKERLFKAGEIRKSKIVASFSVNKHPFNLPNSWALTQIIEIGLINPRNNASDDYLASFVPMPMISAEYGIANNHEPRIWGEIKKGYTHFAEGDVGLAKITPCFENGKSTVFRNLTGGIGSGTTELHIVRPIFVNADYILIFLKSSYFIESGIPIMTGTAGQKRLPTDYFTSSPFPLPPLAEQHRIVAKVDELMTLCDQLEATQAERERGRERLLSASLHRLNQPAENAETFRQHARFVLDHLPRFTVRPEQIKSLRQTILNLAVRGKLVEQDPNDEPAAELLKQIEKEKKLFLNSDQMRFDTEIPKNWLCIPATFPAKIISDLGKKIQSKDILESGKFPVIDQGKVFIRGYCNDPEKVIEVESPIIVFGDHTREIKLVDFDFVVGADGVKLLQPILLFHGYYYLALKWLKLDNRGYGRHFKLLKASFIPLPPLAEQHRIVAKVDELMTICDQLEAHLTTTQTDNRRLLEAVLFGDEAGASSPEQQ